MWTWIVEHWELIFGVVGVIGVVISTIAWIQQRQPKQLDCEVRSAIRLMNPRARDLQLRVTNMDGLDFEDPRILILRIRNTGKKAVSEEDFVGGQPIIIAADGHPTPTVEAQLTDRSPGLPDDIAEVTVDFDQEMDSPKLGKIYILPKLLNPGEWFDIQILFEKEPGGLNVTARFANQKRPMRRLDIAIPERWGSKTSIVVGFLTGVVSCGLVISAVSSVLRKASQEALFIGLTLTTTYTILYIGYRLTRWYLSRPRAS